jgi:O-succinylbenzoate synthase
MSAQAGLKGPGERLALQWRPFSLRLTAPLLTAAGRLEEKRGWLLRLESLEAGGLGWGEAAPLDPAERPAVAAALGALPVSAERADLERSLPGLPPTLAFALGAALAELDGEVGAAAAGGWLAGPPSALLLPAGEAMLEAIERLLGGAGSGGSGAGAEPITVKWKVAAAADGLECRLLERLLCRLPPQARLRLDANGGWDRATASAWADRLAREPRLEWLEQPLAPDDQDGLDRLGERLPVALDESLARRPELRGRWSGWQVRRPSQEGDPRPLLRTLGGGSAAADPVLPPGPGCRMVLSTAFETGIGARWIAHLAALQQRGSHPTAPGLAPGWRLPGGLLSPEPTEVWEAAR